MSERRYELVVGTFNESKGRELVQLLAPLGFDVRTMGSFSNAIDVVEDGDTFAANARKKAAEQAINLSRWVLADDSGLEVDALIGRPGVYSARYAGPKATDQDNNDKLLMELSAIPDNKRTARYYCHVALADPHGAIRAETTAVCGGRIRQTPSGSNGFGYDPLFEIIELHRTFGELGGKVKSALSHRARAMRAMVLRLSALSGQGEWER